MATICPQSASQLEPSAIENLHTAIDCHEQKCMQPGNYMMRRIVTRNLDSQAWDPTFKEM